jgi:hypothetical protein
LRTLFKSTTGYSQWHCHFSRSFLANVDVRANNSSSYFREEDLENALKDPYFTARFGDMGYYASKKREIIEVTEKGSDRLNQIEKRALRNLSAKILLCGGTHGVSYRIQRTNDSVTLRATPVVITRRF